ncbi:MAG: hybrid sensor histidine kinase/response regulator, partial [Nitrospiraceae bacterium]
MAIARILLVDDDPVLLQALPETLTLKLYRVLVETSLSAVEALDQIRKTEYDVILSDLKLPGLDGLQLLDRIRQISPGTPVLLMTGHGDGDIGREALRRGAFAFLQKP